MNIVINGKSQAFDRPISVQELLRGLGYLDHFVAVAINQECVLRRDYGTQRISAGDRIEILAPMAGG